MDRASAYYPRALGGTAKKSLGDLEAAVEPERGSVVVLQGNGPGEDCLVDDLRQDGCRVKEARSLQEAFARIQDEGADLLLLDESPPEMPLIEILKLLRGVWPAQDLPVVVVTAEEQGPTAVEILRAGATDCVAASTNSLLAMARILNHMDQRKTRRASRERTDRAYRAAAANRDVVWEWNAATQNLWMSRDWEALSGVPGGATRSIEKWLEQLAPEDGDRMRLEFERLERSRMSEDFTLECRLREGPAGPKWICCRGKAERDTGGNLLRVSGLMTDISQYKVIDWLTKLPNRENLTMTLDRMLRQQPTGAGEAALLLIDLERFRMLNEALGHAVADALLVELAGRMRKWSACLPGPAGFRPMVARLHGDKFGVSWWEHGGEDVIRQLAERGMAEILRPVTIKGNTIRLTGRIGVTRSAGGPGANAEEMLKEAAFGLEESKRSKNQRIAFFQQGQREAAQRLIELEIELRTALARKQMELFYQPQIELHTGELAGFEALIRWRHPKYGMVPPNDFIPAAENSGLIIPIGAWVIRESARQLAEWRRRYPYVRLHLSANLSVKQFFDKNLVRQVRDAIRRWRLPEGHLCLEITESLFIGDMQEAAAIVHQIKDAGASLMIDDFGTGYSSLYSVSSLPFDGIKIDRSFISRMASEASCREVIRAIVSLATNLDMCVVAEGAETAEQVEALQGLDCGYGQGYFFARPVPVAEADKMLEAMRPAGQRPV